LIARWDTRFRFWQVGTEGEGAVQGCEYYFQLPEWRRSARRLFALMTHAQMFIGADSHAMHVARAFDVPSLILLRDGDPHANHDALYERTPHVVMSDPAATLRTADQVLSRWADSADSESPATAVSL